MTIITIDDLTLRQIKESDAPRIALLCNDETLTRNTSRLPYPYTIEEARSFVARATRETETGEEYRFAICENDILIGCIGIMAKDNDVFDLGYWVGADARGRGVATKAATAIVAYAFDHLNAQAIVAGYFIDNPTSRRVMEKIGFKPTGDIIQVKSRARDAEADTARMRLLLSDFRRSQSVTIRP